VIPSPISASLNGSSARLIDVEWNKRGSGCSSGLPVMRGDSSGLSRGRVWYPATSRAIGEGVRACEVVEQTGLGRPRQRADILRIILIDVSGCVSAGDELALCVEGNEAARER
jgi:hypothetical protein